MDYRPLGRSGVSVSAISLGTMTWGSYNTQDEGFEQMDYALTQGVTFWDTAEMYAVPASAQNYGRTEEIIGNWFTSRGRRSDVFLASKVIGKQPAFTWVRGGQARLDGANIHDALDASLRRLKTDYLDLYQIHWPDRQTPRFGGLGLQQIQDPPEAVAIEETLEVLDGLVRSGKVRFIGLSNETPWGVMTFLKLAESKGLARVVSVQNAYSLVNRTYEGGLAEVSLREEVGLLAYAPVGAGSLTGKYLGGANPAGARFTVDPKQTRYRTVNAEAAISAYVEIARRHGLDPAQMAIAYAYRQPFVTSAIIGATSMAQLRNAIASADLTLSDAVTAEIEAVHQRLPNPCP